MNNGLLLHTGFGLRLKTLVAWPVVVKELVMMPGYPLQSPKRPQTICGSTRFNVNARGGLPASRPPPFPLDLAIQREQGIDFHIKVGRAH